MDNMIIVRALAFIFALAFSGLFIIFLLQEFILKKPQPEAKLSFAAAVLLWGLFYIASHS